MDQKIKKPNFLMMVVLDGWGVTQPYSGNAITQANTPVFNEIVSKYPSMTIRASGEAVGLPWGESGNSEVGHTNLGLGRIVYQDLPRINRSIGDNSFYRNPALLDAIGHAKANKSRLHYVGLVSNGGVHSSIEHLTALLALARQHEIKELYIHAFLDGRDTPYNSGIKFMKDIERSINEYGAGKIATVSGRFYAMDRNNNWDRIAKAYLAMTKGEGNKAENAIEAIEASYAKKVYDEEFVPTIIMENNEFKGGIKDGDAVVFFNFRADRARQMTKTFALPGFDKFKGWEYYRNLKFVCFTQYEKSLPVPVAFNPDPVIDSLGDALSRARMKQLRIAETEKYAHVTYFFNGGREEKQPGEDHVLISSPSVSSYDLKPEMSAGLITDKLVKTIEDGGYDFILVNYANADMVGHTGNLAATTKAVEFLDKCLGRLLKPVLDKDGVMLITADHGNAEMMFNMQTGMVDKEHTANPVPFIVVGKDFEGRVIGFQDAPGQDLSLLSPQGILSDVAPTILEILNIEKPAQMTGRSLI